MTDERPPITKEKCVQLGREHWRKINARSGFAKIVSDDFPAFDAMLCATAALRRAITEMGTSASKSVGQKIRNPR